MQNLHTGRWQGLPPTEAHCVAPGDVAAGVRPRRSGGVRSAARIRNWHDLNVNRPEASARSPHIDSLFDDNVLDWALLETHRPNLVRTVLSIRERRLSSVTLLRTLGHHSRNKTRTSAHRVSPVLIGSVQRVEHLGGRGVGGVEIHGEHRFDRPHHRA
ncbi:Tn3 family transposase [Rhodococcus sp. NPDC060090]|uniref:Tn3 family transposase n=1 Tax=Rhodococcus sp. NPDC060090 TaxID=3347056 RepID=UPI003667E2AC